MKGREEEEGEEFIEEMGSCFVHKEERVMRMIVMVMMVMIV